MSRLHYFPQKSHQIFFIFQFKSIILKALTVIQQRVHLQMHIAKLLITQVYAPVLATMKVQAVNMVL